MKIAIGLMSAILGTLLVIYGITAYLINLVIGVITRGMITGQPWALAILVGVILIVVGCVVYERGIKEK